MTIEKGAEWGAITPTPFGTVQASDEATLALAVSNGATVVALQSGELLRAVGATATKHGVRIQQPSLQMSCDIMRVTIDEHVTTSAAGSLRIGSLLRPRVWVTSGGFIGRLNVAPRAHPNDGLLDALEFDSRIGLRQLVAIRRRMRVGDHLPHPLLTMKRGAHYHWQARSHGERAQVTIDGRRYGRARDVKIVVHPDAFTLCVAVDQPR